MTTKKRKTCPNCGGQTFIGEVLQPKWKDTFEHIVTKCRTCGAWCGGVTKSIKKKKKVQ